MKTKAILLLTLLVFSKLITAQEEFKKEWETKVSVENKWNSCNADLSLIIIGDLKAFSMVDGSNGKVLWTFNAKERLGVKSVEDWTFLWAKEGEPVEVIYNQPKSDSKTAIYLNPRTGQIIPDLTESGLKDKENKPRKVKGKQTFATYAFDEGSSTIVELFFKDKVWKNAYAGNTFEVTVKAIGGNSWTTMIKAKAVTHLNRLLLSDDEPDVMMNVMIKNNKVFVIYEGITVLDLKSGAVLWSTTFDMVDAGLTKQEIGKSPLPTVDKDAVYLCDLSKGEKAIKKLDINTGNVLWRSEKLDNDDVISELLVENNVLIAKFGGYIRKAKSVYNPNSGGTTNIAKIVYEGKSEIRVFDAGSGKKLWSSETVFTEDKFSKSECGILIDKGTLIAASPKFVYFIDPANGTIKSKTPLGKEIDKPKMIFEYDGNYIIKGEEGIASYSPAGKQNYAVSTKKVLFTEFKGEAFIVWTGKDEDDRNEFVRFDLNSGKIMGKLKGCYYPRFNQTGDYFIRFDGEKIIKYKTN